jgi:hypothetical protein
MDQSFADALERIPPALRVESFRFVPILNGHKKPEGKRWSTDANYPFNHAVMAGYLAEGHNYGILTGVGGLVVLDIDDLARLDALGIIGKLPATFTVRTGRGGLHFYLICSELKDKIILEDPELKDCEGDPLHLGELQALGQQVVGPGSRHPNGNFYEVVEDRPIATIDKANLLQILGPLKANEAEEKRTSRRRACGGSSLGDLIPIDQAAWPKDIKERCGSEVRGSHPLHGSTSGKNFAVNTDKNSWHCFRHKTGGGPLEWLAVEAGLISCQDAKPGCLDDMALFKKVLQIARERGFVIPEQERKKEEPHARTVSRDDKLGSVGLDEDGCIKVVDCDKDGNKKLKWLSDCALHIHTETSAKDSTEFIFKGVGAKDHRQVSFTLPASALADPRRFRAALINAFGAKNRVGKLDFETVQRLTRDTRLMKRIEVPIWDGNTPLLPGVGMVGNVEYRLSSKIPAAVYDGDLQAAKECLRKLLKVHKFAPILAAAILGSPAVARWHKNDRFGLGLWGGTGTLKTSTSLAAMGIYGTGYLDGPKLKAGKAGSTVVGANEVFAAAGFLPQIYDDVKTVDSKDAQNYVAVIHSVLEGEEKARGKKDGGLRDSREFLCTPIITGEVRPSEASTSARIFNLNWTRSDDKLLSEVQQSAALLPVIGYHWLRFLAETNFVLGKDFDAFRSKKMQDFLELKYTNPGRLATIYSIFVSVWDLLETSPLGDVFTEARESFKAALAEATATQGAAVSDETEISRFLSGLEELLASNPGLIMSNDGKKTIAGAVIGKRMPDGLFLLPTETLNELGKIKAFSQQPTIDSITQALQEKNFLIPDKDGHLKYRCRLNDGNPRGWYIKAEAFPQNTEGFPPTGNAGNGNGKLDVPTIPEFPREMRERNFSEDLRKNHDRFDHEKQNHENAGNNGNSGNIDSIDRLVDSDFDSKVSVPGSVPSVPGDTNNDCGKEHLTRGAAQPGDSSEKGVTSVKFNTDYLTDWKDQDGGPIMRQFQEGEIVEVSLERAQAWAKRRIVAILEAPA